MLASGIIGLHACSLMCFITVSEWREAFMFQEGLGEVRLLVLRMLGRQIRCGIHLHMRGFLAWIISAKPKD